MSRARALGGPIGGGGGPLDVPELAVWLNGSVTSGFGTAGYTVMDQATGGAGANTGTQTTVSAQPTPVGGALSFDGGDHLLVANGTDLQWTAAGAYVLVLSPGGTPASDADLFTHWGAAERTGVRLKSSGNIEWIIAISEFAFATAILDAGDVDLGARFSLSCLFDGAGSGNAGRAVMRVNGAQKTLSFSGTVPAAMRADAAASPLLGAFNAGINPYPGLIHEFFVCNGLPSAAHLALLENT